MYSNEIQKVKDREFDEFLLSRKIFEKSYHGWNLSENATRKFMHSVQKSFKNLKLDR